MVTLRRPSTVVGTPSIHSTRSIGYEVFLNEAACFFLSLDQMVKILYHLLSAAHYPRSTDS